MAQTVPCTSLLIEVSWFNFVVGRNREPFSDYTLWAKLLRVRLKDWKPWTDSPARPGFGKQSFVRTWEPQQQKSDSESHSVMSNSLWPHGLYSPWNSVGQNTGVGSFSLRQGIFPTQQQKWKDFYGSVVRQLCPVYLFFYSHWWPFSLLWIFCPPPSSFLIRLPVSSYVLFAVVPDGFLLFMNHFNLSYYL